MQMQIMHFMQREHDKERFMQNMGKEEGIFSLND
jgi:hypothetical protein